MEEILIPIIRLKKQIIRNEIILNSYSISDLPEAAILLLNTFKSNTVFAFYGQMGAGKNDFH